MKNSNTLPILHITTLRAIDAQLIQAYKEKPELFNGTYEWLIEALDLANEDVNDRSPLPYYLSEMSSHAMMALADPLALDFDAIRPNDDTYDYQVSINRLHPDPTGVFQDFANAVQEEYDANDEETPTWDEYGLTGDDAVDYNGTYLDTVLDAIRFYMNNFVRPLELHEVIETILPIMSQNYKWDGQRSLYLLTHKTETCFNDDEHSRFQWVLTSNAYASTDFEDDATSDKIYEMDQAFTAQLMNTIHQYILPDNKVSYDAWTELTSTTGLLRVYTSRNNDLLSIHVTDANIIINLTYSGQY